MKTDHEKMEDKSLNLSGPIPLRQVDIIAAYRSQDRDARLLGEYWALNLRIRGLEYVLKSSRKQRGNKTYSPEPLMIMQIKAMKKYANALAIRLDYEQGGRANPEVIARIRAMTEDDIAVGAVGFTDVAKPIAPNADVTDLEGLVKYVLPGDSVPTEYTTKEEE